MTTPSPFTRFGNDDVRALIAQYPLAWVCGGPADALAASLLPLIGRYDEAGRLVALIGHLMRSNPLHAALVERPGATILFTGPDAYVSPDHAGRRDWAPTWNYAQLTIRADVRFDAALTELALEVLIDAMETGRAEPWRVAELGPRYHGMLDRIVGFSATVTSLSGVFKLGQDERDDTFRQIVERLPDAETTEWMRRFRAA